MSRSLLVIAGEVSGDMHAARVIHALKAQSPDIRCWGIGGDELAAAGVELRYHVRDMAVLGLTEVLKRYGFFRRVFNDVLRQIDAQKPDAVLLIDYPGFNLRLAKQVHKRGIKVLYYICPQVWAWHRSRIDRMAEIVDRLMVIFPFEVDVFANKPIKVDFVGHPLVDQAKAALAEPPTELPWPIPEGTRIALLSGSRKQEIDRILPVMLEAAQKLHAADQLSSFIIASPSKEIAEHIDKLVDQSALDSHHATVITGQTREVLRQARAAMVASGTATIETALMGCPMIVVYKTAPMTYWFGKRLIRVPYLGMVNIVASRALCPEFIQEQAEPSRMAAAMQELIADGEARSRVQTGLQEVAAALGEVDAAASAAAVIHAELEG